MEGNKKKKKFTIFISYAHEDIVMAKKIYHDLKNFGLDIWFDKVSLLGGQNWHAEIKKAIRASDYFLALMSSKSVSHIGYVQKELKIALDYLDFYPERGIYVIPIRLEKCEPSHDKLTELHWIDVYPKSKYRQGINKIIDVIDSSFLFLRTAPSALSTEQVTRMIRAFGFFDLNRNPDGLGFSHQFQQKTIPGQKVILDIGANGLMWQQSGSSNKTHFGKALEFLQNLNSKRAAGYCHWRLPTLEEAMSLVEPRRAKSNLYFIDSIFDTKQYEIWTCDIDCHSNMSFIWAVDFSSGSCIEYDPIKHESFVRAVCSVQI